MKAIVHTVKRDASAVRRVGYLANKKELVGDWIGKEVLFNADSLLFDHHGKGRKTRHFVISLEQDCDIATERLAEVAERFMATFAPASAWLVYGVLSFSGMWMPARESLNTETF